MELGFLIDGAGIDRYWNKKATYFPNQTLLSSAFPSVNQFLSYFVGSLVSDEWVKPLEVIINASRLEADGSNHQFMGLDIHSARERYANGFSLCFGDLSVGISTVAELKKAAAQIFGFPELIVVTGYLSPPQATGVLHFDRQHNFFIQKEGVKRWYVSEKAAVKNPHDNLIYAGLTQSFFDEMRQRGYEISLPRDCGKNSYELNPGDVLYVPPGFYHNPETLGEPSLHYTLTVEPACFWKDFNGQMFLKLLCSDGKFFEDYRFLSEQEKSELFEHCFDLVMSRPK